MQTQGIYLNMWLIRKSTGRLREHFISQSVGIRVGSIHRFIVGLSGPATTLIRRKQLVKMNAMKCLQGPLGRINYQWLVSVLYKLESGILHLLKYSYL